MPITKQPPRKTFTVRILHESDNQINQWAEDAFQAYWGSGGRVIDRLVAFAKANDFNPCLSTQPRIATAKKSR